MTIKPYPDGSARLDDAVGGRVLPGHGAIAHHAGAETEPAERFDRLPRAQSPQVRHAPDVGRVRRIAGR